MLMSRRCLFFSLTHSLLERIQTTKKKSCYVAALKEKFMELLFMDFEKYNMLKCSQCERESVCQMKLGSREFIGLAKCVFRFHY